MRQVVAAIWILLHLLLEQSVTQDLAPSIGRITRSEYAACAGAGRMPNHDAEACETYYLCAVNTDGTLTVALAYCPLSTVFSPEKLQCVSASTYACPSASPDVVASAVTSLPADESNPFQCTGAGRFPNPDSADCKLYYLCSRDQNGIMVSYNAQC
uniref:Uncharacterized protein n=1 Tax=Anopheles atroparvus TaxID=41427 RepID=A0A182IWZ0_ANOAO